MDGWTDLEGGWFFILAVMDGRREGRTDCCLLATRSDQDVVVVGAAAAAVVCSPARGVVEGALVKEQHEPTVTVSHVHGALHPQDNQGFGYLDTPHTSQPRTGAASPGTTNVPRSPGGVFCSDRHVATPTNLITASPSIPHPIQIDPR